MIDKINDKYNKSIDKNKKKSDKKKKNNYNVKTNKRLLLNWVQLILKPIIKWTLCKKVNIIKDINNPRISKTPHSKWYIQSYV